jgi:hypothetical protein
MKTVVVIPCYNERKYLASTCASLGFIRSDCLKDLNVSLVLVDNSSTDGTAEVMAKIRDAARPREVIIVQEPVRGYVPARHAGVIAAMELARQHSLPVESILILQADADTTYLPGYIDSMQAACTGRRGQLLEGVAITGRMFSAKFPEFDGLCRRIDRSMEPWFAQEDAQIIVDDKVCGYLLSDYLDWGGHRQEVDHLGREIHAETTRLFMRAGQFGLATRINVGAAYAIPSRRKLWTQALAYFASAGFPRSTEWVSSWGSRSKLSSDFLTDPYACSSLEKAIKSRQRHLLALFALLPAISHRSTVVAPNITALAFNLRTTAEGTPGHILGTLLALADDESGAFATFLKKNLH